MRTVLVCRGVIGTWFGWQLTLLTRLQWSNVLDLLTEYLIIDGVAALLLSMVLFREGLRTRASREAILATIVLVDGIGRTCAGIAVHVWPGLPGFPVTAAAFFGVMALCTAGVGLTEATLVIREETARHGKRHSRPQFAAWPLALAALAALGFGIAGLLSIGEPAELQRLLTGYVLSASAMMFAMAVARRGGRSGMIEGTA